MNLRDPRGLRYAVLLGVAIGFVIAGPKSGDRLLNGLMPVFSETIDNSVFVAWVAPLPTRVCRPARSPTRRSFSLAGHQGSINSELVLRLRGTASGP
jgi:hypothetical protein